MNPHGLPPLTREEWYLLMVVFMIYALAMWVLFSSN